MSLSIDQFADFHESVHGVRPFDWQQRLLRQIVEEHRWPRVLELPTATGKTTCIDIALYALALDASHRPEDRWCPRRIVMVVDRRVIVDQAAERGRKILHALLSGKNDSVIGEVARNLLSLSREAEEPLGVFTLRGGIPKDDGWARTPDQPLILASTVDQLGSRMLVQGYGVRDRMKPVHAGLLANDTLVLLDEVQLSQPFAQTLDALERLRDAKPRAPLRDRPAPPLPKRFHHAYLSATPGLPSAQPFTLNDAETALGTPLGARLYAHKPTRMESVDDRDALSSCCAEHAAELAGRHNVIAVVVNRVATAGEVVNHLRQKLGDHARVILLTGRMRPLDREDLLSDLRPYIMAGRDRTRVGGKLVVVGTQCIEAGADFDFDALVTESASLDALRQRFGRLDRLGTYGRAEGIIVHVTAKEAKDDPIYAEAGWATYKWLEHLKGRGRSKVIDFGCMALPRPAPAEEEGLLSPKKSAPTLLPAYLDLWMQTSPPPAQLPEVALWLHGPGSGPPDVQVVWRGDLKDSDLREDHQDLAVAIVASVGPSSLEAVSAPFATVRKWLDGEDTSLQDVADVEIGNADDGLVPKTPSGARAVRWCGAQSEVIGADRLRPGDTIVVPATRGGLIDKTFDPSGKTPVHDLAERGAFLARGRPLLRLHPTVLSNLGLSVPTDSIGEARSALARIAAEEPPGWRRLWLTRLGQRGPSVTIDAADPWDVLLGKRVSMGDIREATNLENEAAPDSMPIEVGIELSTEDDDSPCLGRRVELSVHSRDVEHNARVYATGLGFPPRIVEDLALAGWLHDVGKADRRFQVMLRGGSEIDFLADETPLAKSAIPPGAAARLRLARLRSGYPNGARHEVQSLAMLENSRDILSQRAGDIELVMHLVASSHGFCRPFAPAVEDDTPGEVNLTTHRSSAFGEVNLGSTPSDNRLDRLDSPLGERFWTLVKRYGWLELCWLEAVLRLADHRASEMEEQSHGGAVP